ncbi:uncharacterized protein VTP21DRAFT_9734 [Calcarisporiella thermophila]|uniref:uncharacterized protein n=1 Tax=Calcarisporiella thermophila TaxID=911321 RepID=UPI003742980B
MAEIHTSSLPMPSQLPSSESLSRSIPGLLRRMAQELQCPICLCILQDPHSTTCNHTFCRTCISRSLQTRDICPICKTRVTKRSLAPLERMGQIAEVFNEMRAAYEEECGEGLSQMDAREWTYEPGVNLTQEYPYPEKSNDDDLFMMNDGVQPSGLLQSISDAPSSSTSSSQQETRPLDSLSVPHSSVPFSSSQYSTALSHFDSDVEAEAETGRNRERRESRRRVILATHLSKAHMKNLEKLAEILGAELVNSFSEEVTHIVTDASSNGRGRRTMKVMQAILSGKYLLAYSWVQASLARHAWAAEEQHELNCVGDPKQSAPRVPHLARTSLAQGATRLFEGIRMLIPAELKQVDKEDLKLLVRTGGGRIISEKAAIHSATTGAAEGSRALTMILCDDYADLTERRRMQARFGRPPVSVSWVFDCVSQYKVVEVKAYERQMPPP